MSHRMQTISNEELKTIHNASMEILRKVGVAFHEPEAISIFKKHGVKVDDNVAYLDEEQVEKALSMTPDQFTIFARNPDKNVIIGGDNLVFAPGDGAPFLVSKNGKQSKAVMEDYKNFCKLVQTSKYIDMNGFHMLTPWDVEEETKHLDMLFSNITLCDKAFIGCAASRQGAIDAIEMAGIVWGGKDKIKNIPIMISEITAISPLIYPQEMSASLIEMAKYGQPLIMTGGPKAGSTGPISMTGVLALLNAQVLAGNTLAQLVNPGTPIAYGGICGPIDFRTGTIPYGVPEVSKLTSSIAQMANFYGFPSRSGGALTDSQLPDIQAGIESTIGMVITATCGINLILHACGILSSFLGFSYEKFLIDEELCGMIRNLIKPFKISVDEIDLNSIKEVGIGGEFLTHPKTLERCRTEFFLTDLMNCQTHEHWLESGQKRLEEKAHDKMNQRISEYQKPNIDNAIEHDLLKYVRKRKGDK